MGQVGDDGSQKLARNSTVVAAWVREHGENQVIRAYDIRTFYDSGTSLLESVIMHKMDSAPRLCVCQRDEDKMQKSICNLWSSSYIRKRKQPLRLPINRESI